VREKYRERDTHNLEGEVSTDHPIGTLKLDELLRPSMTIEVILDK
jgi:hypothetical protein